jgi:hypothetical protein
MRLIDRLFEFMQHRRLTPYTFERDCGIANGYLQKQRKGKGTIGSEILEKISEKHKDLNLAWLINGKGKMLNDTEYASAPVSSRLSESASEYVSAEQTIRLLREKVSILENALADKEKIIRLLEKDIHS